MFEKILSGLVTVTSVAVGGVAACYLVSSMVHDKERREMNAKALELREREVAVEEAKLIANESPAE